VISYIKSNLGLISALLASILWGLNYVLFEKVMNKVNIFTMMFVDYLVCTIVVGVMCLIFGNFRSDLQNLYSIKYTFAANILVYLCATLLITLSIKHSNAVVAGLIEISYPLFIIIFSFFILKETNLDLKTIIGGLLVLAGVVIIISLK
jgi:drug/metabolite transporter (DMT)-like permease